MHPPQQRLLLRPHRRLGAQRHRSDFLRRHRADRRRRQPVPRQAGRAAGQRRGAAKQAAGRCGRQGHDGLPPRLALDVHRVCCQILDVAGDDSVGDPGDFQPVGEFVDLDCGTRMFHHHTMLSTLEPLLTLMLGLLPLHLRRRPNKHNPLLRPPRRPPRPPRPLQHPPLPRQKRHDHHLALRRLHLGRDALLALQRVLLLRTQQPAP